MPIPNSPVDRCSPAVNRPAEAWGRLIARYGRWTAANGRVAIEGGLPEGGFVAVSWHSMNLIIMGVHAELLPHPYRAFVPPGVLGAVMRGCLDGYGMEAVALTEDGIGNPVGGMREMARAIKEGWGTGIALDGPHGPARTLRPGALWLARLTGRAVIPIGAAAYPAIRAPWWDRHLIPLPHSRIAMVYGEPITIARGADLDQEVCSRVVASLDAAEKRAWELVGQPTAR